MNPIEYFKSLGFRVTSDPSTYSSGVWGLRNYRANGINYDAYCGGYHRAFDLSDKEGAPIRSPIAGRVVDGTRQKGNFGGTVVVADHKGDYQHIFGHVKNIRVKVGDFVEQGQILAEQSSTNYDNVPMDSHLHYQVQPYGYIADERTFVCSGIDPLKINVNDYKGVENVGYKVVVDKGHNRHTFPPAKGVYKNGRGYAEFDFNDKLGDRVIELLKVNGFEVITIDPNKSLKQRTDYYDSVRPDAGISIHANAGAKSAGGRCVFYWITSKQGKQIATNIVNELKKMGYGLHGSGLHASQFGSWTNLHMIRECTTFPMVLHEHGFMTNDLDFELIFGSRQAEYIEDMARVDVKALCDYFGVPFSVGGAKPEAPAPAPEGDEYHRVQVGAYSKKKGAQTLQADVEADGFDTVLSYDNDDDLYRVQVGAFREKSRAEKQLKKVRAAGYSDAFIAGNDGHDVSVDDSDPTETVAPKESKTPRLIGEWQTNKHGTQWIKAEGTFTVGGSRIMSRFGSPFLSAPEGGYANPGWSTEYVEMMRQDGHIWIGYYVNGRYKTLPVKTWDRRTGNVGPDWGTFS